MIQLAEQVGTVFDGDEIHEQLQQVEEAVSALEIDHQLMMITNMHHDR
eukprot:SAG31_NODE_2373_length_5846_cov_1.932313_4_plen_48_part_00